ncbi:hypothetical protein AB0I28_37560 [Phytomonospora sp. NPDC050363]|uniref:hypothetical protein n=1 Tax=Phytomonospora sp. NPDC050363 TaxID=3155642 RepID=UPI0033F6ABA9
MSGESRARGPRIRTAWLIAAAVILLPIVLAIAQILPWLSGLVMADALALMIGAFWFTLRRHHGSSPSR